MDSELIVRGQVLAQKQSSFEGKVSHSIQLMKRNSKQAVELLNVKLPEGADPTKYQAGVNVELSVDVSTFEGNMYFKATRDLAADKTAARSGEPRPAAAKVS